MQGLFLEMFHKLYPQKNTNQKKYCFPKGLVEENYNTK